MCGRYQKKNPFEKETTTTNNQIEERKNSDRRLNAIPKILKMLCIAANFD